MSPVMVTPANPRSVEYSLPYWPLGELVSPLVRRPLHRMFRYRQQAIRTYFAERPR
jgi:hypothetical protein